MFAEFYTIHSAIYYPAAVKRLKDARTLNSNRAKTPVNLIFLVKIGSRIKSRSIPKKFEAAQAAKWEKTGIYSELKYRMYPTELRMQFYLSIVDMFCNK